VNVSADIVRGLNKEWAAKVLEDLKAPKIVHYAGYEAKPWNNKNAPWALIYWFYLRKTFWYESVYGHSSGTGEMAQKSLHQGIGYKILRAIWRRSPNFIRFLTHGLAHRFTNFYLRD
jgi:hypothetical protein